MTSSNGKASPNPPDIPVAELQRILKVVMEEAHNAPTEARRAEIGEHIRRLRTLIRVKNTLDTK